MLSFIMLLSYTGQCHLLAGFILPMVTTVSPLFTGGVPKMNKIMREKGAAILMATHDLFRAKESGTHIGIMKSGRLIHSLKSDEIKLQELEQLYLETMKSENYVDADS